jgi:enoyl-CoA hydratase/carnithine racemase
VSSAFETVDYDEVDGVAWIILNRPEVLNAFDNQMQLELGQIWRAMRNNDDVRCAVLTGAGDEAFCSGLDRKEAITAYLENPHGQRAVGRQSTPFMFNSPGNHICPKQCDMWKPVVAAVNGMACGGGLYMLGESDVIIAAEHATFFDPHVTYGMVSGFEMVHLLQKLPLGEVLRTGLMGSHERLGAQRAYQLGLVSEVVPIERLRERAGWIAATIASAPTLAIQGTLRTIWMAHEHARRQAIELAPNFVHLGTAYENIDAGQDLFTEGIRPDPEIR